jgi:hypothetical protein
LPVTTVGVRLFRKGEALTDKRIGRYAGETLGRLGIGAVIAFVLWSNGFPELAFAAAVGTMIARAPTWRFWKPWSKGKAESIVGDLLCSLPDDYVVLNDLMFAGNKATVSHLLIGPNGLFTIETKNYLGDVKCNRDDWFLHHRRIRSLSRQAKRNSMAVRNSIGSLYTGRQVSIPYVAPLLVFVSPHVRLKLFKPTVPVLRAGELIEFIRDYRAKRPISRNEKRTIVQRLKMLQRQSEDFRQDTEVAKERRSRVS